MFCVWNILELAKRHEAPATRKAYAQKNSSTQLQTDSKRQRLQMWRDVKRRFFFLMGKLLRQSMGKLPECKVILPSIAAKFVFCGSSKMFKDV